MFPNEKGPQKAHENKLFSQTQWRGQAIGFITGRLPSLWACKYSVTNTYQE